VEPNGPDVALNSRAHATSTSTRPNMVSPIAVLRTDKVAPSVFWPNLAVAAIALVLRAYD
jgi:hypothetical protein